MLVLEGMRLHFLCICLLKIDGIGDEWLKDAAMQVRKAVRELGDVLYKKPLDRYFKSSDSVFEAEKV